MLPLVLPMVLASRCPQMVGVYVVAGVGINVGVGVGNGFGDIIGGVRN